MSNTFVENYEILSDEEIVSLINGGSIELLQVIIDRYLPKILFFVKKNCSESEMEDAVQEATYALYSAVKNFDGKRSSFNTFALLCIKRLWTVWKYPIATAPKKYFSTVKATKALKTVSSLSFPVLNTACYSFFYQAKNT